MSTILERLDQQIDGDSADKESAEEHVRDQARCISADDPRLQPK